MLGSNGTWVITGGAGYLGRALLLILEKNRVPTASIDNFSTSQRPRTAPFPIEADLSDWEQSKNAWAEISKPIAGVFHFAAHALVGESHEKPDEYFRNNLLATIHASRLCANEENAVFIHSSSCAVYGNPQSLPIDENAPLNPISPYGATKRISEEILQHMSQNSGLRVLNLRYFNPIGALALHGESHEPETHLIPNILKAALTDKPVQVFGTDYPTPDGTCLRDYIHLEDLMEAHICAAKFLCTQSAGYCEAVNIGGGHPTSVLQAIALTESVVGKKIQTKALSRRPGDPAHLEASIKKAEKLLGWKPKQSVKNAIHSQFNWLNR